MAPKEKHGRVSKKQRRKLNLHALSFKQKQHLKEFGELHPSETGEKDLQKYTQVKDNVEKTEKMEESSESESESGEEEKSQHPFEELLSTLVEKDKFALEYKSSSEEESEDDELDDNELDDNDKDVDDDEVDGDDIADDDDNDDEVDDDSDKEVDGEEIDNEINEDQEHIHDDDSDKDMNIKKENKDDSEDGDEGAGEEDEFPEIKDIVIDDKEVIDKNDTNSQFVLQESDPFSLHFKKEIDESTVHKIKSSEQLKKENIQIMGLGKCYLHYPIQDLLPKSDYKQTDLSQLHIQKKLLNKISETNKELCNISTDELSPLQQGLFNILNNYQDICYTDRTHHNQEEIRMAYCLHALNHVMKSRNQVIGNNTKLKDKKVSIDEDFRDQGLTRPKVLILVPFRESAYRIINIMISLITTGKKAKMINRKRFVNEYHEEDEEDKKKIKPEDFDATFAGNIDDHFRFGVQVCKSVLKLYSHFYLSDIIVASPLGLRTIIGSEEEKGDYDYLSSIELLILDQADVFLMQNWDHVLQIFKKIHQQPKTGHGVDFSRIRMWTLEGWSKFYRQTAIFSSISVPEITALYNKQCHNYAGKLKLHVKPSNGSICQVVTQLPQTFHRFDCKNFSQACDDRFNFFIAKIMPNIQEHMKKHTMVFIPSYFDFVRIRNYFSKEEFNFVQVNEYVKDEKISKYRWLFFVGKVPVMLYTERVHFYKRLKIRGIHHVIFYELPHYPHYYSEVCNMLKDPKRDMDRVELTCTVLYSLYDAHKLAQTIGTDRATVMIHSEKSVHMFVTGDL